MVTNQITVTSADGAALTVINGQGSVRCVRLSGFNTVLDGFTVTGGRTNRSAGIYGEANSAILNCIVTSNQAVTAISGAEVYGGGIYGNGIRISNCVVSANSAKGGPSVLGGVSGGNTYGGGFYDTQGSTVDCTLFVSNSAEGGEGGSFSSYVEGGLSSGGGFYLDDSSIARGCVVTGNVCPITFQNWARGGGACVAGGSVLQDTMIRNNSISYRGPMGWGSGAGLSVSGTSRIERCVVIQNSVAVQGEAGGISLGGDSLARSCLVAGNRADYAVT